MLELKIFKWKNGILSTIGISEWRTVIQYDELGAGLDVACIVFCQTLVETFI